MLRRVAYHGVTVADLDRSVAFYRDLLYMKLERTCEIKGEGCAVITGRAEARVRVAILSFEDYLGKHFLKLSQYLFPEGKKTFDTRLCDVGASHIGINVPEDKLQAVYDELRAKGVKFVGPLVHPISSGSWKTVVFTYMLDPDSIVVELVNAATHHAHVVSDFDKAVDFYVNTMGMKLDCSHDITSKGIDEATRLRDKHLRSAHTVLENDEFVELHRYVHPKGRNRTNIKPYDVGCSYLAFEVDDVQKACEAFGAKGARFLSAPAQSLVENSRVTTTFMLDPDGFILELRSVGVYV